MSICDLTFLYFPRGGGIKTYIDAKRLEYQKRGIPHILIAPDTTRSKTIRAETSGCLKAYFVPSIEIMHQGVRYFMFRHFRFIEEIVAREKPETIEIGDKFTPLFFHERLLQLKKISGAKIFVFSHERADNYIRVAYGLFKKRSFSNRLKYFFLHSFTEMLLRRFLSCADEILANSDYTAEELRAFTKKKISVISLGIEPEQFQREKYFDKNLRDTLSGNGKKTVLVHVGRLDKEKKIGLLVNIARRLDPRLYTLAVAGGGTEEAELKKIPCVHLTGYVSHDVVKKYLSVSDLGILVNDIEPFGLVALEMMALGLPIVGPDSGGLSGILERSFSWKMPHDEAEYLRAIEEWKMSRGKINFGENARRIFLEKYTSRAMVDALLLAYKKDTLFS